MLFEKRFIINVSLNSPYPTNLLEIKYVKCLKKLKRDVRYCCASSSISRNLDFIDRYVSLSKFQSLLTYIPP
jgi:hypothetical protein